MSRGPDDGEPTPPKPVQVQARPRPPTRHWHGTKASLRSGDVLLPRSSHGAAPTTGPLVPSGERLAESDDWVYVTTDRNLAWAYAHYSGGAGEPVVLLVEPCGRIERDPEHSNHMPVYRCRSARVVVVDTLQTVTPEQARQGWKPAEHSHDTR